MGRSTTGEETTWPLFLLSTSYRFTLIVILGAYWCCETLLFCAKALFLPQLQFYFFNVSMLPHTGCLLIHPRTKLVTEQIPAFYVFSFNILTNNYFLIHPNWWLTMLKSWNSLLCISRLIAEIDLIVLLNKNESVCHKVCTECVPLFIYF